jgi:hypothetical protein
MQPKRIDTPRQSKANIARLKNELGRGIVTLEFMKLDLTRRRVIGTRDLKHIPLEFHPKGTVNKNGGARKVNNDVLALFDLQKGAWISLKTNSITEIFC